MPCIEPQAVRPPMRCVGSAQATAAAGPGPAVRPRGWLGALALSGLLLGGCGMKPAPSADPAPVRPGAGPQPGAAHAPVGPAAPGTAAPTAPRAALPPAGPSRNWTDYRRQAAQRLVQANPERSHLGPVIQPLLAIPVLDIDLNADGSVRRVKVNRHPSQARDTVQLAIDAVHRAAPFGPVAHLPKPWTITETFLFDEQRRFKPRTLDD